MPIEITKIEEKDISQYIERIQLNSEEIIQPVQEILNNVRKNRDQALKDYTKKFDNVVIDDLKVDEKTIQESINNIDPRLKIALEQAAANIRKFHKAQIPEEWSIDIQDGVTAGQIIRPLEKVGCYIPGGRGAYPSTILMTVIPAKIAGVGEIICCTPPDENGNIQDEILAAAHIAGATTIYKVGGAQAIGAMAYSTETIPQVDKIVGPGNIFVTTAKKLVYGDVDIEFPAGPSELLVLADKSGKVEYISYDMMALAEHDPNAATILVTSDEDLAKDVQKFLEYNVNKQERSDIINKSLDSHGHILVTKTLKAAVFFTNKYAPEHLIIATEDYNEVLKDINKAGSIFLGNLTPVAGGDYGSGTNHVLPTSRGARMYSGLSAESFIKKPTIQELTPEGIENMKEMVITLAESEGFYDHAKSFKERTKKLK